MAMAVNSPENPIADWEKLRDEWVGRLSNLVASVQSWAQEIGWSTRRIEIRMEDSQLGTYQAPALILQEATTRVLLEPVARFAPGVDGVIDLYRMPAYDDIATLYHRNGDWNFHYQFPGSPPVVDLQDSAALPFSKETLKKVLDELSKNGA